jgi:hypothetical protein
VSHSYHSPKGIKPGAKTFDGHMVGADNTLNVITGTTAST